MKDLIAHIAESLVDYPDQVVVNEQETEDGLTIELTVARTDLGKVIGKQGRTARAMRTLLSATATGQSRKTRLDIME
jgi:predicted RNA-binding protein YlqC (UPF0109 family)